MASGIARWWPSEARGCVRYLSPGPPRAGALPVELSVLKPMTPDREDDVKDGKEMQEILETYGLTRSFRAAGELTGCSPKTVADCVAKRYRGELGGLAEPLRRDRKLDPSCQRSRRGSTVPSARSASTRATTSSWRWATTARIHRAPVGCGGEGGVPVRAAAGVSALDRGAGHVGPVGLGSGPDHQRAEREPVLRVVGVVSAPGRDPDLGPDSAHRDRLPWTSRCVAGVAHRPTTNAPSRWTMSPGSQSGIR